MLKCKVCRVSKVKLESERNVVKMEFEGPRVLSCVLSCKKNKMSNHNQSSHVGIYQVAMINTSVHHLSQRSATFITLRVIYDF